MLLFVLVAMIWLIFLMKEKKSKLKKRVTHSKKGGWKSIVFGGI